MKSSKINIIYFGTPEISAHVLQKISEEKINIVGVFTRPDSFNGRGKKLLESPVKQLSKSLNLPIFEPKSLRNDAIIEQIIQLSPDLIIVAAYGLIIPKEILDIPRYGVINIHPSLLPKYRGPSPVASALLNGESITGVSIMMLDEGMDTGPILAAEKFSIRAEHNTQTLTEELFQIGAKLLVSTIPPWVSGEITPIKQNTENATTTKLLTKDDGFVDWGSNCEFIARQIQAFNPWPSTFTSFSSKRLIIEKGFSVINTQLSSEHNKGPGYVTQTVLNGEVVTVVVCGEGFLVLSHVKLEGSSSQDIEDFVRGKPNFIGSTLG
tara:strand:+ start:3229 stop:4197 length:969 start_codon:yes stop_codon:yes gene_type:complete